ncbi:ISAs1 family transposase [Caballeronia calidae]|uniref:ISAs1 family transposase n=1 Tax=Caballeronia calidae TaxID=1777139 RepID=UPI00094088E7|nr:ISAs1 family transposase [Caballeronia calidae]
MTGSRRHTPQLNGIPSHDTFDRAFAALDSKQFEACFVGWMSGLIPSLVDQIVAIDGKTVPGSHQQDKRAIHQVSAYGAGLGLVLGQGPHGRQEQRNRRDTGAD